MGIREKINQNPIAASGVVGGVALLLILVSFMRSGGSHGPVGEGSNLAFYSIDDGKSFFKDSDSRIAPLYLNFNQAARA
jgi:hypothetical protein